MGHTMSIHSQNEAVILEFGLHKPAYRVCVNTPATLGAIGYTTGLDPSMTLGCGGFGGNITSDNISPKHLLNIKRLAYEIRPVTRAAQQGANRVQPPVPSSTRATPAATLPQAPKKPVPEPIAAEALTRRIDAFLSSRGIAPGASPPPGQRSESPGHAPAAEAPAQFVCEDDVRMAVKNGQKILVGEKTIITPAARDAGEAAKVFAWESFPR
jgi:acetaldehyde dehydrogenase (acetylating)